MKRFAKKSFYRRFLLSYFTLLIIPFLTIFFMYGYTQESIQSVIIESNAKSLYQFTGVLDSKFSEMSTRNISLLSSAPIVKPAIAGTTPSLESGYEVFVIKGYLSTYSELDYFDTFVYYHKYDRIISNFKSSLHSREYYGTYYSWMNTEYPDTPDGGYNRFTALLSPPSTLPQLVTFGGSMATPHLGMVFGSNMSDTLKASSMTAVVILRPETLRGIIQDTTIHGKGSIMVIDGNGQTLMSSDARMPEIDLAKYAKGETYYTDKIGGMDYIIQISPSRLANCTYASVMPATVFWEQLYTLQIVSGIFAVLSLGISAILAWLFAKRSYSPITTVLRTISNRTGMMHDHSAVNEMEFISDVLSKSLEENSILNSHIESKNSDSKMDFIVQALQGLGTDGGKNESRFLSDSFCVVYIRVEDDVLSQYEGITSFIISNIMQELCSREHQCYVVGVAPHSYATVIQFTGGADMQAVISICRDMQSFVKANFSLVCTVAASAPAEGSKHIAAAYQQACKTMEYRFLLGKGKLILYSDIAEKAFQYNNLSDSRSAQILLNYVTDSGQASLSDAMAQIMSDSFMDGDISLEAISCFKYDMINIINKIIYQIGAVALEREHSYIQALIAQDTFAEFERELTRILESLHSFREESREQNTICDKAEAYILANYSDQNINNTTLGGVLGLSAAYLSKLFKAQKGVGPAEYLAKVRIDKAKELLRESASGIEEIASKTGFLDSSALIKAFKKNEGVTPGAYRKLFTEKRPPIL